MRKYVIALIAILVAVAVAVAVSSQLKRSNGTAEAPELPAVVVSAPTQEKTPGAADTASTVTPVPPTGGTPAATPTQQRPKPDTSKLQPTARPKGPIGAVTPSGEVVPVEQTQDAAAILRRAASAYANVRSMKADFTQWQENPLLGKRTNSRGTVYQRRPDKLLLKWSQPAGDVIVSDGQFFWIYYPSVDARQVLKSAGGDAGGLDLFAQFIGDPTRRFNYTMHGTETVNGRSTRVFTLVPKEDAGYKSLKVWLDTQDNLARRFELTGENGVVQHYDLLNLEVNPTLSDALFRFTPPKDARIVER